MIQSTCSKKHYDYRDKKFCQVSTARVLKQLKELEDIRGGRKIAIASMIKGEGVSAVAFERIPNPQEESKGP